MTQLLNLRIDQPAFLVPILVLCVVCSLTLLIRPGWRRIALGVAGIAVGAGVGWLTVYLLFTVWDVFGIDLSERSTQSVVATFAGIGLAVTSLVKSRAWRKVVALVSIPLFVIGGAGLINKDFGAFYSINEVLGVNPFPALDVKHEHGEVVAGPISHGTDSGLHGAGPSHGQVGRVAIPSTASGFPAREAVVYLPPVALTDDPPALPVLYALAGQPGTTSQVFTAGHLDEILDRFAASHNGYAPIVIAPDQLSAPTANPLCIDSKNGGNSATYLLDDVRTWATTHLRVSGDPAAWGIFGFSQGATCAVQFATAHPELFGSALASSAELGPSLGSVDRTISDGFAGSRVAYERAQPLAIMKAHGPYADSVLVLGAGSDDGRSTEAAQRIVHGAQVVGIDATFLNSAGTGHDWHTVSSTIDHGLPLILRHMGLGDD